MTLGKCLHIAAGVMLVLLFTAGSASAAPTLHVDLGVGAISTWEADASTWTTSNATFDLYSCASPINGQASWQIGPDTRAGGFTGAACQTPSPGTLILGAIGAALVGALRMRRML